MKEKREPVRVSVGDVRAVYKLAEGREDSEFVYFYPVIVFTKGGE